MFTFYTTTDKYTLSDGEISKTFSDVEVMVSVESYERTLEILEGKEENIGILPEGCSPEDARCTWEMTSGYSDYHGHERTAIKYVCKTLDAVEEYLKLFNVDIGNPMKIYW